MKNRLFKITGAITTFCAVCLMLSSAAYAAGTVSISASSETAVVGDEVSVTYKAESDGDAAEAPQISVEYNPNRLNFLECDKEGYGGGGGGLVTLSDMEATIKFSVLSGGVASVKVSAVLNGDGADVPEASVDINVDGEDTAAAMEAAPETSDTGVEAGTIMYSDGTKVISTVFADEYMPKLFHKEVGSYEGAQVEEAVFDMDSSLRLLYATDTAGENGSFSILSGDGTLADFRMIQGIENRFIVILPRDDSANPPAGFTSVTLQWNNQTIGAYMYSDESGDDEDEPAVDDAGVSSDKFFLLYAMSSEGNKGWYLYDQEEGTYQRYASFINSKSSESSGDGTFLSAIADTEVIEEEGFFSLANIKLLIIIFMAFIIIVLIVIVIYMGLKLKDYQSYDYIDEEEDIELSAEASAGKVKVTASQVADAELNGDDNYLAKRAKQEEKARKKQEKEEKRNKKRGIPEAMDWESFGAQMEDADEDERRPMGNNVDNLAPQYRNAAIKNQAQIDNEAGAVEPEKRPAHNAPIKGAEQPVKRPEQPAARPEQPMQRPEQPAARPEQPMSRPEMPVQRNAGGPVNPHMGQQMARPEGRPATPPIGQPVQPPVNMPVADVDLDEDFEFEFLDFGE